MDEFPFNNETRYERVTMRRFPRSRASRELTTLEIHFRKDARFVRERNLFLFRGKSDRDLVREQQRYRARRVFH